MTNINSLENQLKEKSKFKIELEQKITDIRVEIETVSLENALMGKGLESEWYREKKSELDKTKREIDNVNYECGRLKRTLIHEKRKLNNNHSITLSDKFVVAAKSILNEETYSWILKKAKEIDYASFKHKDIERIN